jgi:hypothetical protein
MKGKLFAFGVRLLIVGGLSFVVAVLSIMPLPRGLTPAAVALFYPVFWLWESLGCSELFLRHTESLAGSVYNVARLVFPVYLIVSYLPAVGRWVRRRACELKRASLRVPKEFALYFCAGTVVGTLLGVSVGLRAGLLWPEWGMLLCVLGTAAIAGWVLAIIRCTSALGA